jgi:hypothetical protein
MSEEMYSLSITSEINTPIFLVGAERSGTTLLRLMLSHHSQIAWCNEFDYAVHFCEPVDLPTYYDWLETHRIFQATGFTIDPTLSYPALVQDFLCQKQVRENKPIIGATVHHNFDRLLSLWPQARFLHLVRDGRDVALSCIKAGWAGNGWTGCQRWQTAELLWEKLAAHLNPEQYQEIIYENLILTPQLTLDNICTFIGVNYENNMLNYPQYTTYESPNPKLINQWQNKLYASEIQLIESQIGNLLEKRGYPLSKLDPVHLTSLKIKILLLQRQFKSELHRCLIYSYRIPHSGYDSQDIFEADC